MSGDVVARAKAALEGITPGPWETIYHFHDTSYPSDTYHVLTALTGDTVAEVDDQRRIYDEPHGEFGHDAEFIAAARSLIPGLVAEVDKVAAECDQWKTLWRANTGIAGEAMRERDEANAEVEKLRDALETIQGHCIDLGRPLHHIIGDILDVIERAGIEP